ncbi:MAG: DUF4159 domain-containing protein, partial [Rhodobacteraceae bacterium]|nr:DUF4159 domain-containing protein [Paracoccaceae bacterium]
MTLLGGIGFIAPWLLVALAALPILWLVLRAVPPTPTRYRFPGVVLILGLRDDDTISDRTPWWLALLRILAVACTIVGLAGPVLNPNPDTTGSGPVLLVLDGGWSGATRWPATQELLSAKLAEAHRSQRPVAILQLTDPDTPTFHTADALTGRGADMKPNPWTVTPDQLDRATRLLAEMGGSFDTWWFSDGLSYPGHSDFLAALEDRGDVRVFQSSSSVIGLTPVQFEDGRITISAIRSTVGLPRYITIFIRGLDPAGTSRVLDSITTGFKADATQVDTDLSLPAELLARVTRFEIAEQHSAGAVVLADDRLRHRPEVALISGHDVGEGLDLLSPSHYLEQALVPIADLLYGVLLDIIPANPDVIILADITTISAAEQAALIEWIENGGLLLRFAGPRLAASDIGRDDEHPLLPVRLRAGGRSLGGAMSWGEPKVLAPFAEESPFFGLTIPSDVLVNSQLVAQPDPTLADRVIAALNDGTPLVTRKELGQGQIILFHVTANAEWSTLPLSGLFISMLERLAAFSANQTPKARDLEGTTWVPVRVMDGFGRLLDAENLPGVDGPTLAEAKIGPNLQPGVYQNGDRRLARNVLMPDATLTPVRWPERIPVEGLSVSPELPMGSILLAATLILLVADVIASLALSGRLMSVRGKAVLVFALGTALAPMADAQTTAEDELATLATSELALAHVLTGDARVDEMAQAGLQGLSNVLFYRTSVEPIKPIGVDLERDELAFFPLLYWPVTLGQPYPSDQAYAKLNIYLRSGGLILFDTRDADIAGFSTASPNGRKLQDLVAPLA